MTITEKLDRLAELHSQADALALGKQELIDQAIPPEVKVKLEEIEAEFSAALEMVGKNIATLESEIIADTKASRSSASGGRLMCIYNPGGETVKAADIKLCAARWQNLYPKVSEDILGCIKGKKSSASIQAIKSKEPV